MALTEKQQIMQDYGALANTKDKKTFDSTDGVKYDVIAYPPYLGDSDSPNFMMIFVNGSARSKFTLPSNTVNVVDTTSGQTFIGSNGGVIKNSTTSETAAGTIRNVMGKFSSTTPTTEEKSPLDGIKASSSDWLKKNDNSFIKKPNVRMKYAIALPIPDNLNSAFSVKYSEAEVGVLGSVLTDVASGQSIGGTLGAALPQVVIKGMADILGGETNVGLGTAANLGKIASKISGSVVNQRQEIIFEKVEIRTFVFDWSFVPKNKVEHDAILNIIKVLKANMLPELAGDTSTILIMPSEFDIQFRFKNKENPHIGKINTCSLQDVAINYTSGGKFVAAAAAPDSIDEGKPLCIHIQVKFTELQPLLREHVEQKGF